MVILQDLADFSGINKASISQYVNGSYVPSLYSAKQMARYLGVSPEYLMGYGEDDHNHIFEAIKAMPLHLITLKKCYQCMNIKKKWYMNLLILLIFKTLILYNYLYLKTGFQKYIELSDRLVMFRSSNKSTNYWTAYLLC